MTHAVSATPPVKGVAIVPMYQSLIAAAGRIPLSLVQLAARVAVAKVFWDSSHAKLASWPVTQQLFAMEYQVPVLPPDVAAVMATAAEYGGAVLIFLGLFTRLGALGLLGLVAVIQLTYPGHWGEHLLWASLLMLLLARGAGAISLDALASRHFGRRG